LHNLRGEVGGNRGSYLLLTALEKMYSKLKRKLQNVIEVKLVF